MKRTSAWVWVPMPEKKYLGFATFTDDGWFHLTMVDPIPNRLNDECYGETSGEKTIKRGVALFARGMLEDRRRYCGDKDWRPTRETLRRLWKGRQKRRKEIANHGR